MYPKTLNEDTKSLLNYINKNKAQKKEKKQTTEIQNTDFLELLAICIPVVQNISTV